MDADKDDVGAIGAYRIERTLGRGGFGVVYVGIDERLGRRAAIKQLLPALSSQRDFVERFFREARAAASIDHPGIVEIYDVGWHTDGSAYFAMKLLDGDSLAQRLKARGMLTVAAATTIARQVASAVAAAHARGIIHRDLKPDNIMLVRDPEVGERAVVLDFGIAKLTADGFSSSQTNRTVTGVLLGTPLYMSPEQCRGARDIDARSDIYALGCIVFEMLAGRPPFPGTAGEVVGMHQFVAPPSVRAVRGDVPAELDAVVVKALAKEPARRFGTIDAFAEALAPFTAIDTPPPKRAEPKIVDVNAETMASISEVRPLAPTQASQPDAQVEGGARVEGGAQVEGGALAPPPRWPWAVGGAALAIATGAIVFVAMSKREQATTSSNRDAAALATSDAVASTEIATSDARALDARAVAASGDCKDIVAREAWDELIDCQRMLAQAGDRASADVYYKLALLEGNAKTAFDKLSQQLAGGDLGVEAALHGIPPQSIYRPRALAAFAKAEPEIVGRRVIECTGSEPTAPLSLLVVAAAARRPCKPLGPIAASTDCDQARIDGRRAFLHGAYAKTLEIFQHVATCYPNNAEARLYLAAAACKAKNASIANKYMPQLEPLEQIVVARICKDSGLDPQP